MLDILPSLSYNVTMFRKVKMPTSDFRFSADANIPQFLSFDNVARLLGVSRRTINRWVLRKKNPMPYVELGDHSHKIPWEQFLIWLDQVSINKNDE